MKGSRRTFIKSGLLLGAAAPLAGCERMMSELTSRLGESVPAKVNLATGTEIDPDFHFLSRTTYGGWPGDLDALKELSSSTWLEQQLDPESIDDKACDLHCRRLETRELDAGTCYEFKKPVLRDELIRHALLRAVYTRRQLFEVMVGFWSDHLNIYTEKGDCVYLKATDDKSVIRKHALGNFADLIRASAASPAMLVYLDGKENKRAKPSDIPNENYARELLELHTLGVHGGYSQHDVSEVARCLTGWRLQQRWQRGSAYFDNKMHDDGTKVVLGHTIGSGGGRRDLDEVIDIVCRHPSTAVHIATKLVRHFVGSVPPPSLVAKVSDTFATTSGDIKSMLRTILSSEEFKRSQGTVLKRPFNFIVSCLRSTAAQTYAHQPVIDYLNRMGEAPFQHPTPDGYPDVAEPWLGTLLWRWNFALALMSGAIPNTVVHLDQLLQAISAGHTIPGEITKDVAPTLSTGINVGAALVPPLRERTSGAAYSVDRVRQSFAYFIGRQPSRDELNSFNCLPPGRNDLIVALILSSPAFQRH